MIDQTYCNDSNVLSIFLFIKSVMNIIKIVVPIILIIMSMLDILKVVVSTDKDSKIIPKKTLDRFASAIFVFLIISITDTFLSLFGQQKVGLTNCWVGATKENIANLKEKEALVTAKKDSAKDKNSIAVGKLNTKIRKRLKKASSLSSSKATTDNKDEDMDTVITKQSTNGSCIVNLSAGNGTKIVEKAMEYVGNPYVYGGNSLTGGIDCSGFTKAIMAMFGAEIPRTSYEQATVGQAVSSLKEARAGDLIIYPNHVAIYDGKGGIVHAANSQLGITTSSNASYNTILAIRRIIC